MVLVTPDERRQALHAIHMRGDRKDYAYLLGFLSTGAPDMMDKALIALALHRAQVRS